MSTYYNDQKIEVLAFEQAKSGNVCSGDAYTVIQTTNYTICAVVDGLGSGEGALQSAKACVAAIHSFQNESVGSMITACNQAMYNKRGAVVTIIKFEYSTKKLSYCNHGNIGFALYGVDGTTIQPVPTRGFLSGKKLSVKSSTYSYSNGSTFILYSDGVKHRLIRRS